MSRRLRLVLPALIGLCLAGLAVYWFHVAAQLGKGIEDFATQMRARGWTVDIAPPAMGGFPRSVTARLERVALADGMGLSWKAEGLSITVPLFDPLTIAVNAPGFHRLTVAGWAGIVSAAGLDARIRLDPEGRPTTIGLDGTTLALEQPGIDPLTLAGLSARLHRLRPAEPGHETASLALSLALSGLELPDITELPLARRIDGFQVEARVMGSLPEAPPLAALAAWSADGGTVELDRLALDWAPLSLEADGTVALDPLLQPLVATTARLRGWSDLLGRMAKAGLVEPAMAEAARVMLAILARPDAQGRSTLTLPFTLQDGLLTAGQVRLARLPPLPLPPPGGSPP